MKTCPSVGVRSPVRHLKKVDLPAPFGPIRQRSSRALSLKLTLLDATTPPKRIVRPCVSRIVSATDPLPIPQAPCLMDASERFAPEAGRPEVGDGRHESARQEENEQD